MVTLPQTLTFPAPAARTYGDAPFALSATASSGLPVTYTVNTGQVSVSGSTVTITGAGSPQTFTSTASSCTAVTGALETVQRCTSLQVSVGSGLLPPGRYAIAVTNPSPAGCTSTQVCASTPTSAASCKAAFTSKPLLSLPQGVGLYPSLAYKDANAVIAYYDQLTHALKAASGSATFNPITLDGDNAGSKSADSGLFPSVAIEPTGQKRIAIAWHDPASKGLHFFMNQSLAAVNSPPGPDFAIDTGYEPPAQDGPSFVGANVALHFTSDGKLFASYQNSTAGDLRLAQYAPAGWTVKKSWKTGAVGFFSSIAQLPGTSPLFITHTQIHAKLLQNHPIKDNTVHVEVYQP